MNTVIDAECILANLLQKREHITMRDLNYVRQAIEEAVPAVYVDVTTNCLVWAVNRWNDMFVWEGDTIRRLIEWPQSYVDNCFNWRIPDNVRNLVLSVIESSAIDACTTRSRD
jgi:hypothetical protein